MRRMFQLLFAFLQICFNRSWNEIARMRIWLQFFRGLIRNSRRLTFRAKLWGPTQRGWSATQAQPRRPLRRRRARPPDPRLCPASAVRARPRSAPRLPRGWQTGGRVSRIRYLQRDLLISNFKPLHCKLLVKDTFEKFVWNFTASTI